MTGLVKIGRTGGLFGVIFSRPVYRTTEPVDLDGETIPAGYITDLVSSPWWARWMLPLAHMRTPALRHDMRRRLQRHKSLAQIDGQFREDMRLAGVPEPVRTLAYWAVRTNKNR